MVRFVCSLLVLLPLGLVAQFPFTPEFVTILDSLDVRVNHPFDAEYKLLDPYENPYLREQQRVFSREEKLEIRFAGFQDDENGQFYGMPHIRAAHLLMNLASNEEDAITTVLSLDENEMAALNADWARVYLFRPKRNFSDWRQAQMVVSYKEGRGILYTVLLFNKPPGTLLGRQLALRWR